VKLEGLALVVEHKTVFQAQIQCLVLHLDVDNNLHKIESRDFVQLKLDKALVQEIVAKCPCFLRQQQLVFPMPAKKEKLQPTYIHFFR
jgi:hypothetical protein